MRATAVTRTGREGTGAVLEATEVGGWETVVCMPSTMRVVAHPRKGEINRWRGEAGVSGSAITLLGGQP